MAKVAVYFTTENKPDPGRLINCISNSTTEVPALSNLQVVYFLISELLFLRFLTAVDILLLLKLYL